MWRNEHLLSDMEWLLSNIRQLGDLCMNLDKIISNACDTCIIKKNLDALLTAKSCIISGIRKLGDITSTMSSNFSTNDYDLGYIEELDDEYTAQRSNYVSIKDTSPGLTDFRTNNCSLDEMIKYLESKESDSHSAHISYDSSFQDEIREYSEDKFIREETSCSEFTSINLQNNENNSFQNDIINKFDLLTHTLRDITRGNISKKDKNILINDISTFSCILDYFKYRLSNNEEDITDKIKRNNYNNRQMRIFSKENVRIENNERENNRPRSADFCRSFELKITTKENSDCKNIFVFPKRKNCIPNLYKCFREMKNNFNKTNRKTKNQENSRISEQGGNNCSFSSFRWYNFKNNSIQSFSTPKNLNGTNTNMYSENKRSLSTGSCQNSHISFKDTNIVNSQNLQTEYKLIDQTPHTNNVTSRIILNNNNSFLEKFSFILESQFFRTCVSWIQELLSYKVGEHLGVSDSINLLYDAILNNNNVVVPKNFIEYCLKKSSECCSVLSLRLIDSEEARFFLPRVSLNV